MRILFLSRQAQADLYKACNTLVERAIEAADDDEGNYLPTDRDEMLTEARTYRLLADRIGYPAKGK